VYAHRTPERIGKSQAALSVVKRGRKTCGVIGPDSTEVSPLRPIRNVVHLSRAVAAARYCLTGMSTAIALLSATTTIGRPGSVIRKRDPRGATRRR
jgi:hypothetical protein